MSVAYADLSTDQRRKADCRTYTHQLVKRGKLIRLPCWLCGDEKVEAHHPDHQMPRVVIWLCHRHHIEHHRGMRTGTGRSR